MRGSVQIHVRTIVKLTFNVPPYIPPQPLLSICLITIDYDVRMHPADTVRSGMVLFSMPVGQF